MSAVRRAPGGLVEKAACQRLHRAARTVPADLAIVELGAHRGRSTGWIAAGSRGAHVWSIDPWDQIAPDAVDDEYAAHEPAYRNGRYTSAKATFDAHIAACGLADRVTAIQSTGTAVAAMWGHPEVGLLFHDAVHSYPAIVADLTAWLPHLADRCTVALHDLGNPSFGVEAAAHDVLEPAGFAWDARERLLWAKDPSRRGLLVVHR